MIRARRVLALLMLLLRGTLAPLAGSAALAAPSVALNAPARAVGVTLTRQPQRRR